MENYVSFRQNSVGTFESERMSNRTAGIIRKRNMLISNLKIDMLYRETTLKNVEDIIFIHSHMSIKNIFLN